MSEIRSGNLTEMEVNYFCNISFYDIVKYLTWQKGGYLPTKKKERKKIEYIPAVTNFQKHKKHEIKIFPKQSKYKHKKLSSI